MPIAVIVIHSTQSPLMYADIEEAGRFELQIYQIKSDGATKIVIEGEAAACGDRLPAAVVVGLGGAPEVPDPHPHLLGTVILLPATDLDYARIQPASISANPVVDRAWRIRSLIAEVIAHHRISVIPLYINVGGRGYLDGIDITREEFYERLPHFPGHPTTAVPSPQKFQAIYNALVDEGATEIINVDPGTMNPFQHGEVYVTDDGAETDLDLGHYERFTHARMTKKNNFTSGSIYHSVITEDRRGDYLAGTVQVIPHITDEIKASIRSVVDGEDLVIVEIGGTVGDIESLPFLEAMRQFRNDVGR